MLSDGELLRGYAERGEQAAFTELVQRHINLVYRAALRRVGRDAHVADDVTQKVFIQLAKKARSLTDRASVAGWLYTSTRFVAADAVRAERRRRHYEQEAQTMNEVNTETPVSAEQLEPLLDEVMDLLPEHDREAVLLYFFEGHTFPEVGAALSVSADAARMRVNRTLEHLRTLLTRRGIASSATALAGALSVQSTFAAPASLALAVAGNALSHVGALGGSGASLAARLLKLGRSSRLLVGTGIALVIVAGGFGLHQRDAVKPPAASDNFSQPTAVAALPRAAETSNPTRIEPPTPVPALPADSSSVGNLPVYPIAYGDLSDAEQKLLVRLWFIHETAVAPPGVRVALKVGPAAPGAPGIDPLVARGWIALGLQSGAIHLTKAGVEYCEIHRAEIETRAITMHDLGPKR